MYAKRKIEIFTANCPVCDDAVALVKRIACSSCEVEVLDMSKPEVSAKAKQYGIRSVPAIAIAGKLASCCANAGIDEASLRAAGIGTAMA